MASYHCENFRPLHRSDDIRSADDAAKAFANRLARRQFGRRGYARIVRQDPRTIDGSNFTYEVFIGVDGSQPGETVGHNEWLYVSVHD